MRKLKRCKKDGHDNLSNEHMEFGGINQVFSLMNLFIRCTDCSIYAEEYECIKCIKATRNMKVTGKATGVFPCCRCWKYFVKIVLNRIKTWVKAEGIPFPSSSQTVYQDSLYSILCSILQRRLSNKKPLAVSWSVILKRICLLDPSSAFDSMWHAGFTKLYEFGTGRNYGI